MEAVAMSTLPVRAHFNFKLACIAILTPFLFSLSLHAQRKAPAKANQKTQMAVPAKGTATATATAPVDAPAKRFTFTLGATGGLPYGDTIVSDEKITMVGLHVGAMYHNLFRRGFLQKLSLAALFDGYRFLAETIPAWAGSAQVGLGYRAWERGQHGITILATGGYLGGVVDNKESFGMGLAEIGLRYHYNFSERWGFTAGVRQQFFIDDGHFFLGTQIVLGVHYEI